MAMENHGAGLSSNQCDTSLPGVVVVGKAVGSEPSVSVQVTLSPDPARDDRKVASGSSWPMYCPLS